MRDVTAASQRRTLVLLVTGAAALLVFMGLLLALYGFARARWTRWRRSRG